MRIIAGEWRGRRIHPPGGRAVRPTLDRVREAWMSIVQGDIPGARVLDLFSGSGALGLEALSRGAKSVLFVERDPRALHALRENVATLAAGPRSSVQRQDVFAYLDLAELSSEPFDIAFADPPYTTDAALRTAERWLAHPFARVLGVEHSIRSAMPSGGETRRYGDSAITFYRCR